MKKLLAAVCLFSAAVGSAWADVEIIWGITGAAGSGSSLYAINPANGQVLGLIGSTGQVNLSGLALQPGSRALYSAQGAIGAKKLYRIDKTTGLATAAGTTGLAVADSAFSPGGVLYTWGAQTQKLYTINLATGAPTQLANSPSTVGKSGIAFAANGVLYMVRSNSVLTVSPATGAAQTVPVVVVGANFDNLLAINAAGVIYGGARTGKGAPTKLYTLNPLTGATRLVGSAGVGLTSIIFDSAAPPTIALSGKAKIKTKKASLVLKGTATSVLPLMVSTKGSSAQVVAGKWTLKVKLKKGKNKLTVVCADGMGQSVVTKVTVTRE